MMMARFTIGFRLRPKTACCWILALYLVLLPGLCLHDHRYDLLPGGQRRVAEKAERLLQSKWDEHCSKWVGFEQGMYKKKLALIVYSKDAGLGNKMKSWKYAFFLSLLLGRKFEIYFDVGFPIGELLQPNKYHWTPEESSRPTTWPVVPVYCSNLTDGTAFSNLPEKFVLQLNKEAWKCDIPSVVQGSPHISAQRLSIIAGLWTQKDCYFLYMHKFSQHVLSRLPEAFLDAKQKVSLHLRWGDKHFRRNFSAESIDTRLTPSTVMKCFSPLRRASGSITRASYLYLLTDVPQLTIRVLRRCLFAINSNIKSLRGVKALHTGRLTDNATESELSFEYAFRDMAAIMIADHLIAPARSTFSTMSCTLSFKAPVEKCTVLSQLLLGH